jgi:hypothetical protein
MFVCLYVCIFVFLFVSLYVKKYAVDVNTSRTPEEGAHSPSWPNGLMMMMMISLFGHSCRWA